MRKALSIECELAAIHYAPVTPVLTYKKNAPGCWAGPRWHSPGPAPIRLARGGGRLHAPRHTSREQPSEWTRRNPPRLSRDARTLAMARRGGGGGVPRGGY